MSKRVRTMLLALVALVHYAKLNLFPTLRSEKK